MNNSLKSLVEEKRFIQIINETYKIYFNYGSRSSKKVDYFHQSIKNMLESHFTIGNGFEVNLEYKVDSCNSSGNKKCDIVITKDDTPYIVFPVKIIMTNYKQNKNNSWENLTGELCHIRWRNPELYIIPINIFMNKTPYLKKNKEIKKFEIITESDIKIYSELINHGLCYDMINYIVDVDHIKKENGLFDEINPVKRFDKKTKYRVLSSIVDKLL
jgi:hypothetical protein